MCPHVDPCDEVAQHESQCQAEHRLGNACRCGGEVAVEQPFHGLSVSVVATLQRNPRRKVRTAAQHLLDDVESRRAAGRLQEIIGRWDTGRVFAEQVAARFAVT